MPSGEQLVRVRDLQRVYRSGDVAVHALRGVDLEIGSGEFVAIMGPSGCGKSTLLNLLGCLDRPTRGSYRLHGREVGGLRPDERAEVRGRIVGFVFQDFHLLPRTTAAENVELPLLYAGVSAVEQRVRAQEALGRVGLAGLEERLPRELSGGQQQRVAIARALVAGPTLLLADEPTGNLDSETSSEVLTLLEELHRGGLSMVLVTHDREVASRADRLVRMRDGRIVEDVPLDAGGAR